MKSKNNPSAKPNHNINLILQDIIQSRFYEKDYNNLTKKLLYEDISYDNAINNGIQKIYELNIL